jgi:hypothetical protein
MHDRLIELLYNFPNLKYADLDESELADYLLENGVIVPPCKVGDILWIPSANSNEVYSKVIKEILIHEKDGDISMYIYASSAYFSVKNIGKTVFLTKEEAERALEGGVEE